MTTLRRELRKKNEALIVDFLANSPAVTDVTGDEQLLDKEIERIVDAITAAALELRAFKTDEEPPVYNVLTHKSLEQVNAKVTAILTGSLGPKAIQDAMAKFFKLTPQWEGNKFNRQWMQWAMEQGVTPEQIELAADKWRMDVKFNWAQPSPKLIQEKWLMLTETKTDEVRPEYKPFVATDDGIPNPRG